MIERRLRNHIEENNGGFKEAAERRLGLAIADVGSGDIDIAWNGAMDAAVLQSEGDGEPHSSGPFLEKYAARWAV